MQIWWRRAKSSESSCRNNFTTYNFYNLQLYLFYIFTITHFCSNISIFTLYGCVMDVLILLNIVCTVRKCLESK